LDFLGAWPFRRENPNSRLLDFLGFPWILSSESRLINGLRGIKRGNFFVAAFSALKAADGGRGHAEARIIHGASLSPLPIFRNGLSFRNLPLGLRGQSVTEACLSQAHRRRRLRQRRDTADFIAATV
jgi:hypothetical protein